jgi:hypothetical protein
MKFFKKSKLLLLSFFLVLFAMPFLSRAQVVISPVVSHTDIGQLLQDVTKYIWVLVAPLSTIMMIWAGILFLTSEGDPAKISRAKSIVTYVVVGIIVAIIASGLSYLIAEILS